MKLRYSISNLRSIESLPLIELRPITILLGMNSAGKSTYLRTFPLIKQTIDKKSSAPILWFGDTIDFGNFKTAVRNSNDDGEISFIFNILDGEARIDDYDTYNPFPLTPSRARNRTSKIKDATVKITLKQNNNKTIRHSIDFSSKEHGINLSAIFLRDGIFCERYLINGFDVKKINQNYSVYFSSNSIFSPPQLVREYRNEGKTTRRFVWTSNAIAEALVPILTKNVDKRITPIHIRYECDRILNHWRSDQKSILRLKETADVKSFQKFYQNIIDGFHDEARSAINSYCETNSSFFALRGVFSLLSDFFKKTTYLAPARARGERYYRHQELEISEVSADGQNLAMFLASLPPGDLPAFSSWVEALFGYGIDISRSEGHLSIHMTRNGISVNVADTGYGVSQLLPVLAQIWWSTAGTARLIPENVVNSTPQPITMEQPELHLHPAHQSRIADALVSAIKLKKDHRNPLFILETHSETLINRLGELIALGEIDHNDIQIAIFENKEGGGTTAILSEFEEDGTLTNWPWGFFNYRQ